MKYHYYVVVEKIKVEKTNAVVSTVHPFKSLAGAMAFYEDCLDMNSPNIEVEFPKGMVVDLENDNDAQKFYQDWGML